MKRVPLNKKSDYIALEKLISERLSRRVCSVRFTYPRTLILSFGTMHDTSWGVQRGDMEFYLPTRWTLTFKDGTTVSYDADDWSQTEADVLPAARLLVGSSVTSVTVHRELLDLSLTFDSGSLLLAIADRAAFRELFTDEDDDELECFSIEEGHEGGWELLVGPRLDYRVGDHGEERS